MVPSLTCGGPVLLGQGVREVFDPQVVIVTWWVGRDSKETGQVKPPGVVTRPEGESGGGDKPVPGAAVPTTSKHQPGRGRGKEAGDAHKFGGRGQKTQRGLFSASTDV